MKTLLRKQRKAVRWENFDIYPICPGNHGKSVCVTVGPDFIIDNGKLAIWKFKSSDPVESRVNCVKSFCVVKMFICVY
jgi:hypothetical protein